MKMNFDISAILQMKQSYQQSGYLKTHTFETAVSAKVDISPEDLNLNSKGGEKLRIFLIPREPLHRSAFKRIIANCSFLFLHSQIC